ncbi:hypothetical protein SERLADRAFT_480640 [Serpula lacrymans var. lacrymans S7.9]|nr:uncharacterized protein SERLADRAFT_480640 [Serpula lacrymans var. lacrymans S7.9]EGO18554.1 hypothetical protein SERLADRAFT_480640 [Serpula lacrymans var. lacrymans S7.9]
MPSTHASAVTFFATYIPLACFYLPPHPTLPPSIFQPKIVSLIVIPWASLITLSRVWLKYHTWPQVGAGVVYGVVMACIWFQVWYDDIWGIRTLGGALEALLRLSMAWLV